MSDAAGDDTILLKRATRTGVAHVRLSAAVWGTAYRQFLSAGWAPSCVLTMEDGLEVDLAAPCDEALALSRTARYLSRIPRWLGHTDTPFSVAQHGVLVSELVPPRLRRQALIHDNPEGLIGDMASPMKRHNFVYRAWERAIWLPTASLYDVPATLDPAVHRADMLARLVESRDLRRRAGGTAGVPSDPADRAAIAHIPPLVPLPAEAAEALYLARWAGLAKEVAS